MQKFFWHVTQPNIKIRLLEKNFGGYRHFKNQQWEEKKNEQGVAQRKKAKFPVIILLHI